MALSFKAQGERLERERKLLTGVAWLNAALTRCDPKRFPSLEDLTGERRPAPVQTPEEMKAIFAAIRARAKPPAKG